MYLIHQGASRVQKERYMRNIEWNKVNEQEIFNKIR